MNAVAAQPEDYEYRVRTDQAYGILACRACTSEFLAPRPAEAVLPSFYPRDYHAYNEDHGTIVGALVAMRGRKRAEELGRYGLGGQPTRIFDVGTGDCRHFEDMARHGAFEFAGVEINPDMVKSAREKGFAVEPGSLEALDITPYEGRFDVVTMYHVLEHVVSPAEVLARAFSLLRPGGMLCGQLPCVDSFDRAVFGRYWGGYHFPRHLQMFSSHGLATALERAGFGKVRVASALHLQAALSLQNLLVGGLGWRPGMTYGKTPAYPLLLLTAAPFCMLEFVVGRGGIMNFWVEKPA
ncbi:class I SAM-dependent methyltransferase [Magnetospirillum sp. UT-4]|uniref:class I SAM-dependent methyltransferase n=1 Tax=Magnetospirillum sp. UT-4 TaxID=2681467 RepID=UPI001572302C|nr:class I SAM-dependent methyltransferase [Magnetospirillum sp. UT-4]